MKTQDKIEKLLRLHCSDDRQRFKVPYRQGEWFFATNGITLVAIPVSSFPSLPFAEDGKAPNCLNVIPEQRLDPIEFNIPKLIALIETAPKVPFRIPCDQCKGDGYLECDLGHEHECEECDGDGYQDHSNKTIPNDDQVFVLHGIAFRVEVLNLLVLSASLLECENIQMIYYAPEKPCLFSVDGIHLLISPAVQFKNNSEIPDYITVNDF